MENIEKIVEKLLDEKLGKSNTGIGGLEKKFTGKLEDMVSNTVNEFKKNPITTVVKVYLGYLLVRWGIKKVKNLRKSWKVDGED